MLLFAGAQLIVDQYSFKSLFFNINFWYKNPRGEDELVRSIFKLLSERSNDFIFVINAKRIRNHKGIESLGHFAISRINGVEIIANGLHKFDIVRPQGVPKVATMFFFSHKMSKAIYIATTCFYSNLPP